jgi:toxin-antitoxin system PIN domain toxin
MRLPDVNVLIYAHREDAPEHDLYATWLKDLATGPEPFALSEIVMSGFVRIVTNPKIFTPATPMETALAFCHSLVRRPQSVLVVPTHRHWRIFVDLCQRAKIKGPLVTDAYLAALAIEHGCELVTTDSDFSRFEGLRWSHPLEARQQ